MKKHLIKVSETFWVHPENVVEILVAEEINDGFSNLSPKCIIRTACKNVVCVNFYTDEGAKKFAENLAKEINEAMEE